MQPVSLVRGGYDLSLGRVRANVIGGREPGALSTIDRRRFRPLRLPRRDSAARFERLLVAVRGVGAAEPAITTVAMALQALSCFSLVYFAARTAFGNAGGIIAPVAISSSPLCIGSLAIGQESGYLAISYAGQLAFALAALKKPEPRYAILAGLFAAAALCEIMDRYLPLVDYSCWPPVETVAGCCQSFAVSWRWSRAPGNVRTWLLTGNPLYPNDPLHLGLPTNAVHVGLHEMYSEIVGPLCMACGHVDAILHPHNFWRPVGNCPGATGLSIGGRKAAMLAGPLAVVLSLVLVDWLHAGRTVANRAYAVARLRHAIGGGRGLRTGAVRLYERRPFRFRMAIVAPTV